MKLLKRILPILVLALPAAAAALELPKVVSPEWLEKNAGDPALRIVDIRKPEEYKAGHVPGSVNVFYGSWAVTRNKLDNQLPEDEDLADLLKGAAIEPSTAVVIVNKVDAVPDQVNQTRVAWTLAYAGVNKVGILDGGFNKWAADKKPVSTDDVKVAPAKAEPKHRKGIQIAKDEVSKKLGKVVLLDTRTPDYFFGIVKVPMAAREGRLPASVNLPSAWLFTKEGGFRPVAELQAIAEGVVGKDKSAEIITYCDTGRLASGWWFVLSEVLGYQNVRLYDGSTQEWTADPSAPMLRYSWK